MSSEQFIAKQMQNLRDQHKQAMKDLQEKHEQEMTDLKEQNNKLQNQNKNLEELVLSHCPPIGNMGQDVACEKHKDLFWAVPQLITDWFGDVLLETSKHQEIVEEARHNPARCADLVDIMRRWPELQRLTRYEETEDDLVVAAIWRILYEEIFSKELYGAAGQGVHLIEEFSKAMIIERGPLQKQPGLYPLRVWRAQTYGALFVSPGFPNSRKVRCRAIARKIYNMFLFIAERGPDFDSGKFLAQIAKQMVEPAIEFQENFESSVDLYLFENDFEDGLKEVPSTAEFVAAKGKADYQNILKGRLPVDPAKVSLVGDEDLRLLCAIAPSLKLRSVAKNLRNWNVRTAREDARGPLVEFVDPPTTIAPGNVLVAYGTREAIAARTDVISFSRILKI